MRAWRAGLAARPARTIGTSPTRRRVANHNSTRPERDPNCSAASRHKRHIATGSCVSSSRRASCRHVGAPPPASTEMSSVTERPGPARARPRRQKCVCECNPGQAKHPCKSPRPQLTAELARFRRVARPALGARRSFARVACDAGKQRAVVRRMNEDHRGSGSPTKKNSAGVRSCAGWARFFLAIFGNVAYSGVAQKFLQSPRAERATPPLAFHG